MSKDHSPGTFSRPCGYQSDLEIAESGPMVKSVNTSFGSQNHNSYIMLKDGTHEHFYYDPSTQRSGWHGNNYATRNNHPKSQVKSESSTDKQGGMKMERNEFIERTSQREPSQTRGGRYMERNEFIERLKVDQQTIQKCNDISMNAAKNADQQSSKTNKKDK